MSDESRTAFEAWAKNEDLREGDFAYILAEQGWFARDAEVEKLKARVEDLKTRSVQLYEDHNEMAEENERLEARVEELETRVVDLSVMIDKERLENGIEIVALKEKVRWFQAKEVG